MKTVTVLCPLRKQAPAHLEAVGGEEGLGAGLVGAAELEVAGVGLLVGAQVALRRVIPLAVGEVAHVLLAGGRPRRGHLPRRVVHGRGGGGHRGRGEERTLQRSKLNG